MIRLGCVVLLLLLLPLPAHGEGKGHGVEARAVTPLLLQADSGTVVTCSFLVTNTGSTRETFFETVQGPAGWIRIAPQDHPFPLKPGEQSVRIVALAIPASTPSGSYSISYAVQSRRDYAISDLQAITVQVRSSPRLELDLETEPGGAAGALFSLPIRVSNRGNTRCEAEISAVAGPGLLPEPAPRQVTLGPGESRLERLGLRFPTPTPEPGSYRIELKAVSKSVEGAGCAASRVVRLQVAAPAEGTESVGLELSGPSAHRVAPGKVVSGSFRVTNRSGQTDVFLNELELPTQWKRIIHQSDPFALSPGERQAKLVSFAVPADTPAGSYRISYRATSLRTAQTRSQPLTVTVLALHQLALVLEQKPELAIAGQPLRLRMRLANRGNSRQRIRLAFTGAPEYPLQAELAELELDPGQSQSFNVSVAVDDSLIRKESYFFSVRASTLGAPEGTGTAFQSALIPIIPVNRQWGDRYHRLPLRFALIGLEQGGRFGYQSELTGAGGLDPAGSQRIDFLLRTPDMQQRNLYGLRDEYRLNYASSRLELLLGDQGYALSPLLEQSRYGRGAGLKLRQQRFAVGGFYLDSRWQRPKEHEGGAFVEYQQAKWGIRANLLRKERESDATQVGLDSTLYSLQSAFAWGSKLKLRVEYGASRNAGPRASHQSGYRVELNGTGSETGYSFEKSHADADFPGSYHDVDATYLTLSSSLGKTVRGYLSYRELRNNLSLDPGRGPATSETSYRAGVSKSVGEGGVLALDLEHFEKGDRLAPPQFNFSLDFLTLTAAKSFRLGGFQFYLDRGIVGGRSSSANLESYRLDAFFTPAPGQRYTVFARSGNEKYTDGPKYTLQAGLRSAVALKRLSVSLDYQATNPGSSRERSDELTSQLEWTLPLRHLLSFRGRWIAYRDERRSDSSFLFSYAIPWSIPVGTRTDIAVVGGRIYDLETGRPLENVVVNIGAWATVSDRDGRFTFPALPLGSHYLIVEPAALGPDRVPADRMPLPLDAVAGKPLSVELRITRAGQLSGRLARVRQAEEKGGLDTGVVVGSGGAGSGGEEERGIANLLVEAAREGEKLRQMTDEKGGFSFANLRPGSWRVRVYPENLPPYHRLEREEYRVELVPGAHAELEIKVLRRVRKIRFLPAGTVIEKGG